MNKKLRYRSLHFEKALASCFYIRYLKVESVSERHQINKKAHLLWGIDTEDYCMIVLDEHFVLNLET